MSRRLFHVLEPAAFDALVAGADLAPASLASEGFVHLSFAEQLAGTLAVHYADAEHLVLVEVALDVPELRVEPSRGGALFPHVHAPIPRAYVLGSWPLVRGADGFGVPSLGSTPDGSDAPARTPLP